MSAKLNNTLLVQIDLQRI